MKVTIQNHLLFLDGKQVSFKKTPNFKGECKPVGSLIHYTADTSPSATIGWFMDDRSDVSADLLIDRNGEITQFVPFNKTAWHAGESYWKGLSNLNNKTIGIELTNAGLLSKVGEKYFTLNGKYEVEDYTIVDGLAWQNYTPIQIEVLKAVNDAITDHYKLAWIAGHNDVSPKRKIDPGKAFPWKFFKTQELMKTKTLSTNANLRIDPSTDFTPIQVLPKNTVVIPIGAEKDGFSYVKLNDTVKGWVSSKYLI